VRLIDSGVMMPVPEGSLWDWHFTAFSDGRVAMMIDQHYIAHSLTNMSDDWGMVLFPRGPRASGLIAYSDENVIIIPSTATAEEADRILAAIDFWHRPLPDDDPDRWKDELWSVYRDERAINETVTMIRDPARFAWKYHWLIPGLNRGGDITWFWHTHGDPAQLVESVSQSWDALIADANF
jgi:hypothetical protein